MLHHTRSLRPDCCHWKSLSEFVASALRPLPHWVVNAHHGAAQRVIWSPEWALILVAHLQIILRRTNYITIMIISLKTALQRWKNKYVRSYRLNLLPWGLVCGQSSALLDWDRQWRFHRLEGLWGQQTILAKLWARNVFQISSWRSKPVKKSILKRIISICVELV